MKTLHDWVAEDRRLETAATSRTLALMEHRWKAVHEGGCSVAEYARALGKGDQTVRNYVNGWGLWQSWDESTRTSGSPMDAYALAGMSEAKRAAVEVVSEQRGVAAQTATRRYKPDVDRAREIIEAAPNREAGVAKARETTQRVVQMQQRERENQRERAADRPRAYVQIEYELEKGRRALTNALLLARESSLDAEATDLLEDSLGRVRSVLDLVNLAIVGGADVDWDRELQNLQGEA